LFVLTVSTDVPALTIEEDENRPDANFGSPETVSATVPENPWAPTATLNVVLVPRVIVRLDGVTEIVKSPLITSVTPTLCVSCPLTPVIVSGYVPGATLAVVVTVSRAVPDAVTEAGANVAAAPCGSPATLSATTPEKPFTGETDASTMAVPPGASVWVPGLADKAKSGTVIMRVAGALLAPALSVTVNDATYFPGAA
jgi:hypothetical protein